MIEQLYFEILENEMYISKTCKECENDCKVLCLSENAVIYCNKFKRLD